jgi:hypothetical protein
VTIRPRGNDRCTGRALKWAAAWAFGGLGSWGPSQADRHEFKWSVFVDVPTREIAGQKVGATIWQWQPLVSNRWHRGIRGDDDQRQIIQLDVETFVPLALSERPLPKEGAAGNGTAAQVYCVPSAMER